MYPIAGQASLLRGGVCRLDRDPKPTVRIRLGETVTFHIPFAPTNVELILNGQHETLSGGSTAKWRATSSGGPATLRVTAAMGRVNYRVWLAITDDQRPAKLRRRPGRLLAGQPLIIATDEVVSLRGCIRSLPVTRGLKRDILLRRLSVGTNLVKVGVLPPGRYSLRLEARDLGGNLSRHVTTFTVRP